MRLGIWCLNIYLVSAEGLEDAHCADSLKGPGMTPGMTKTATTRHQTNMPRCLRTCSVPSPSSSARRCAIIRSMRRAWLVQNRGFFGSRMLGRPSVLLSGRKIPCSRSRSSVDTITPSSPKTSLCNITNSETTWSSNRLTLEKKRPLRPGPGAGRPLTLLIIVGWS